MLSISAFLIIIIMMGRAQLDVFLLTGSISGYDDQLVSLIRIRPDGTEEVLSAVSIRKNSFRLSSKVDEEGEVQLEIGEGKVRFPLVLTKGQFIFELEKGQYRIKEA